jgi:hypothetical protein
VNEPGYDGGDLEIVHAKDVRGNPPPFFLCPLSFESQTTEV